MSQSHAAYFVPEPSYWPLVGSVGLFTLFVGTSMMLNGSGFGTFVMGFGLAILLYMMFGWFGTVIRESESGKYNAQVDTSFRIGMMWFIFSEVMFFAAFFGALFYARTFAGPWLSGEGMKFATNELLWPSFEFVWPLLETPDPAAYVKPEAVIGAWGIPALNTLILLTSGVTVTWAHWGLKKNNRNQLVLGLALTVLLGAIFMGFQIYEYAHAYRDLDLKLTSGIYGSTFFMLTGFHGAHVTIGAIMLAVIMLRAMRGHFTAEHHFAFEATAWYWHFVDVVWLFLFVCVYWL